MRILHNFQVFDFQVNYMVHWQIYFDIEIPVDCLLVRALLNFIDDKSWMSSVIQWCFMDEVRQFNSFWEPKEGKGGGGGTPNILWPQIT